MSGGSRRLRGKVVATQSELYSVASGSAVFDNAYNHVDVSVDASVSRSWDKLYTLSVNDSKTTLGKQTVIYEPSSGSVKIFRDPVTVSMQTEPYPCWIILQK